MKKEITNNSFFSEFSLVPENHFKLYASCIPVIGSKRGTILDLQRGSIHFFPNTILELLEEYTGEELFEEYALQKSILLKHFNYLYDNDLIFCTDEPLNFPDISTKNYFTPNILDFLSVEVDTLQSFKLDLFQNIDEMGIRELVLVQNKVDIDNITQVLNLCNKSKITGIIITTPYSELIENSKLIEILQSNSRILKWIFHSTQFTKNIHSKITFNKNSLKNILCKRIENVNDFVINININNKIIYIFYPLTEDIF